MQTNLVHSTRRGKKNSRAQAQTNKVVAEMRKNLCEEEERIGIRILWLYKSLTVYDVRLYVQHNLSRGEHFTFVKLNAVCDTNSEHSQYLFYFRCKYLQHLVVSTLSAFVRYLLRNTTVFYLYVRIQIHTKEVNMCISNSKMLTIK